MHTRSTRAGTPFAHWALGSFAALAGLTACISPFGTLTRADVLERAAPSVIRLEATLPDGPAFGLGFAVSETRIATHLDLIDGASRVVGRTGDGTSLEVRRVIAIDEARRLVVLDTNARELRALRIGEDRQLSAGAPVYAIGNPQGEAPGVVEGLFQARRRTEAPPFELLETTLQLAPGWIGAPLLDARGRVIGVATQTLAERTPGPGIPSAALEPLLATRGQGARFEDFAAERGAEPPPVKSGRATTSGSASAGSASAGSAIERNVPNHPLTLLDGCEEATLRELASGIVGAIELGAPIYNRGDQAECFRIYERAARALSGDLAAVCPGGSRALEEGLRRADSLFYYRDKAWALRDAFDGLLSVIRRRLSR